ncbi:acyl-CoA N-acyltransferase [Coprinopsis sp. MPI-PUGE-AT-0042]|nr:acyl-CoA N-acyltransferase [Coprinopsis sp. MPI-PUGE-AT-0042]
MDTPEIPAHEVIVATTPEDREKCLDVRIKVFHEEQGFPLETEIDELVLVLAPLYEDIAIHFLLRLTPSLAPVGTIRLVQPPGKDYWKLSRLAVLKEYRRYRFGRELVQYLHTHLKQHALQIGRVGTVEIVCHSQMPVQGFYQK